MRMIDFLIIGGGIAGLSAGAQLSRLGRVTLLEGEAALGHHTSGRSAALFEPTYGQPPTIALNQASAGFFHDTEGLLSPRGLLLVGNSETKVAFSADMLTMLMQPISLDEARAKIPVLNPMTVTMAGYHAEAWDIDTDLMMQGFAREIRANGGQVLMRMKVSTISREAGGWSVTAGGQNFTAPILVNAAGAWADEVARMAGIMPIGLQAYRRSMARVAAPEGYDVSRWPMLFGPGEAWYMKPDAGCLLISPADETPVEPHDSWAEDITLATGIARYEEHVTTPVSRLLANWAGLRTFAPDRNLVIGPDPADSSFMWMAGQGGYGFQTAPAASKLLADLAGGSAATLDTVTCAALSPARFS